jgi:hypothetical protein
MLTVNDFTKYITEIVRHDLNENYFLALRTILNVDGHSPAILHFLYIYILIYYIIL